MLAPGPAVDEALLVQESVTNARRHARRASRIDVRVRTGIDTVTVEVTDDVPPSVVSLPHGWGHDAPGTLMEVASRRPGVNSNVLTDGSCVDPLSGNAVLNGIPVEVVPA